MNLAIAKLIIFVNGNFNNNKNITSQLGFVIVLINETRDKNSYYITSNIIHWKFSKCKRIIHSVLILKIYGIVSGFDMGFAIYTTLNIITDRIGLNRIPFIIATDSFLLYKVFVKLGTSDKKRLIINIIFLRKLYERREMNKIK